MKKLFLLAIACIATISFSNAQETTKNAIGLRLGDSNGFGAEISYQRAIGIKNNRIELDFGWKDGNDYNGIKLVGLYHWVWQIKGDFNWYAGPGIGFSSYTFDNTGGNDFKDSFVFVAGNVGIEYRFDFPLLISLDFRPELGFGEDDFDNNDLDIDVGLGFRYLF